MFVIHNLTEVWTQLKKLRQCDQGQRRYGPMRSRNGGQKLNPSRPKLMRTLSFLHLFTYYRYLYAKLFI